MTSTTYPLAAADVIPLTMVDRCDRCASRAYVRATLPNGSELLFCGHHSNEHRAALLISGASFHDETDKLTIARESGFSV
ncbi:MAG: hypothetical protein JWM02_1185 [Frankiales bacterium]|nr:hypothetical protein [Frankiales bacterium]